MGARFVLSTVTGASVVRGKVQHHLSCGHDYYTVPLLGTSPQVHRNAVLAFTGNKERCKKCEK